MSASSAPELALDARAPAGPGGAATATVWLTTAVTGLMTAAVLSLLGAPLGLIWAALAPHVAYVHVLNDGFFTGFQPVVGGDLVYAAVCAVAGLLAGLAVRLAATQLLGPWLRRSRLEWPVVAGLVVGAEVAALVASRVGTLVRADGIAHFVRVEVAMGYTAAQAQRYFVPVLGLVLHARLLLLVLPGLALLGYLARAARD